MDYILISGIVLLSPILLVTAYNFIFRAPLKKTAKEYTDKVSVLIPARNEEDNIQNCLESIIDSDIHNIEIIVLDDDSADGTASAVREIMDSLSSKIDVRLIKGEPLPEGWLGKNWACQQLYEHSTGGYIVFIDADVVVDRWFLRSALDRMKLHSLAFLSVFPAQTTLSLAEKVTVPYLQWMLVSLLPLMAANSSRIAAFAAANGQFMMFERSAYIEIGGHDSVASEVLEDMKLAQKVKESSLPMNFLIAREGVYCRMYRSWDAAHKGLAKNILKILPAPLLIYLNCINLIFVCCFVSLLFTLSFLPLLILIIIQRAFAALIYNQSWSEGTIFALPQTLAILYIELVAITDNFGKGRQWKGRVISA